MSGDTCSPAPDAFDDLRRAETVNRQRRVRWDRMPTADGDGRKKRVDLVPVQQNKADEVGAEAEAIAIGERIMVRVSNSVRCRTFTEGTVIITD